MSSSRLPGKMLRELNGRPLLWYPISAITSLVDKENVVVLTSDDKSDDPLAEYCHSIGINFFRGDLHNVAKRFADAAKRFPSDIIVRICGDNVFVNHELLARLNRLLATDKYDFISNTPGRTFPFGVSVESVRTKCFLDNYNKFKPERGDLEHVMPYFYHEEHIRTHFITNDSVPEASGIHLAVDTQKDFNSIEAILKTADKPHYELGLKELSELYMEVTNA